MDGVLLPLQRGERSGEVVHMYPRSAIDVGRIFIGQEGDVHGRMC
jgi:hypothetical protein